MRSKIFIEAAVITLIVFIAGFVFGKYFEDNRIEEVKQTLEESNIKLGDLQIQTLYFDTFKNTTNFCDNFVEKNLEFGDEVYRWGLDLDKYERANKISIAFTNEKRRYVLFKLQFLLNCIKIKDVCNSNYDVLVYFYNTTSPSIQQRTQDIILADIKDKCGRQLMFVPIPSDMNIGAVEILKAQYNIKTTPAILINEEIKLEGLQQVGDLKKYLICKDL